jgi:hypothetical protein
MQSYSVNYTAFCYYKKKWRHKLFPNEIIPNVIFPKVKIPKNIKKIPHLELSKAKGKRN